MKFYVNPVSSLAGTIKVDGDKSVSHRSIIMGSLAQGITRVSDILEGEDVLATIAAFRAMGIEITRLGEGAAHNHYEVHGAGLNGLQAPSGALDMGNSGTAFRLLGGLLAAQAFDSTLTGDASLVTRPMGRIIDPLRQMGASIDSAEGLPPLSIHGNRALHGIRYETPMASAQVKSAILFAGLYASGKTTVIEPGPTRDHTERMLAGFGYEVDVQPGQVSLEGGGSLLARDIEVPSDLSSAAFFIVAGLITPNADLLLSRVGMNPSRNGVIPVLQRMGGRIDILNPREVGGEPVADIRVRSSELRGVEIRGQDIALAIDEIPVISVAAAVARGATIIADAAELRVKESDRIASTVAGLRALGVNVDEQQDGMVIHGAGGVAGSIKGGEVESCGDHRIAMAFTVAGGAASGAVTINDCRNVATSFPNFVGLAGSAGMDVNVSAT